MQIDRDHFPGGLDVDDLYKQFRHTFEQFYNPLCKYAFSLIKEREACEDIVQEVFARIWERRKDLLGAESIRYYLFTAVRNNCFTYLKEAQRLPILYLPDNEIEEAELAAWDNIPGSYGQETVDYKALLGKGINQLPPKCKEVFLLSRMGQLSCTEIASQLGLSVKTVNNQLWKAMKLLRAFAKHIPVWWWLILFLGNHRNF
jgi:RNA polymerase sigma-70 factor (ECF subfamily)